MDWQQNRLFIAGAVLLLVGALAFYVVRARTGDTVVESSERPSLPAMAEDDITALELTRPATDDVEAQTVRLERHDGAWHVVEPITAPADPSALDTALDKLDELEVVGIAASHASHHEELEVDDAHGVHVVVHGADDAVIADLIIGAFRGGNTMVRVAGQDQVVTVRGSIRFAFSRDLKDWRNRSMLDLEADRVQDIAFTGPNGTFHFARPMTAPPPAEEPAEPAGEDDEEAPAPGPTLGDWQPVEVSYVPAPAADVDAGPAAAPGAPLTSIEHYAASRVRSVVSSLAHMRASDFAETSVTRDAAGITAASPRVTLTVGDGATAEHHTITLGSETPGESHNFYAMRDGDDTIFVISRFLSEKVSPTAASFAESATPAPAPTDGEPEMPDMPGGPGGQIPPELMEQIQRQLQAQGMGGP
jgi:hypothetical protein